MLVSRPQHTTVKSVELPSSKSISNRVLIINALSGNTSLPHNLADCDDTNVLLDWMNKMPYTIDVGAAGTAMRFSTALLAVTKGTHVITGSQRMKQRPIHVLVDALRILGADIQYVENGGFPPLRITGTDSLKGGRVELDGSMSSQFISALMIVAPYFEKGLSLVLQNQIISMPYINMTMSIMRDFGADVQWVSDNEIRVNHKKYVKRDYWIENDWSASSYWYEILALSNSIERLELPGLYEKSIQGDSDVSRIFEKLGVSTRFEFHNGMPVAVLTKAKGVVKFLEYDFVNQPDLAQTIIVTCCLLKIPFRFSGLSTLKIKETDRIAAMVNEMAKMGYKLDVIDDKRIEWNGEIQEPPKNIVYIDTYKDHRMAMAFAPAALVLENIFINDPQVITKSYPQFWEDLASAGFILKN